MFVFFPECNVYCKIIHIVKWFPGFAFGSGDPAKQGLFGANNAGKTSIIIYILLVAITAPFAEVIMGVPIMEKAWWSRVICESI